MLKKLALAAMLLLPTMVYAQKPVSDWKFPGRGVRARYDRTIKTTVYDLGGGYEAFRDEFDGHPIVVVTFPRASARETELEIAFAVAMKVLRLPKNLRDALPEKQDPRFISFHTASGGRAIVHVMQDRESANVRVIPANED